MPLSLINWLSSRLSSEERSTRGDGSQARRKGYFAAVANDTRGAAMVEAVIVFPLFIIISAALIYYHQAYSAKIERSNVARSCAWTYSVGGCVKKPEGCPINKIGSGNFVGIDEGVGSRGDLFKDAPAGDTTEQRTQLEGVLGASNSLLIGLLGEDEGIEARPSREVEMPSLLGGETRKISGNYAVMCNERTYTNIELIKASYCAISKELPGCK